jgi:hypothetical protein
MKLRSALIIVALVLGCIRFSFPQSLTCPDPKGKIVDQLCKGLLVMQDSDVVPISVTLPIKTDTCKHTQPDTCPPYDPKKDTAYWNQLKNWSYLLFTTFDLRDYHRPDLRLAPPADSAIDWVYRLLRVTKATALLLRDPSYITSINPSHPAVVSISREASSQFKRPASGSNWYDPRGRKQLAADNIRSGPYFPGP